MNKSEFFIIIAIIMSIPYMYYLLTKREDSKEAERELAELCDYSKEHLLNSHRFPLHNSVYVDVEGKIATLEECREMLGIEK